MQACDHEHHDCSGECHGHESHDCESHLTIPQRADVDLAIYGFPKNKNWPDQIRGMSHRHGYQARQKIKDIFKDNQYREVTEHVKYYLNQGTTKFVLTPVHSAEASDQPIMIVKGEWYGGKSGHGSRIRHMISCDAIQAIGISCNGILGLRNGFIEWKQTPHNFVQNHWRCTSNYDTDV